MNEIKNDYRENSVFPIIILLIGYVVLQIATPLQMKQLMSAGTWMIVFSSIIAVVSFAIKGGILKNDNSIFIMILLFTSVVLSMIFANNVNYNGVVAAFCFLEIPFFLISYDSIESKKLINLIYLVFFILSVYYIALSFSSLSNVYYTKYGLREMEFVSLGYNNPNETSMYLVTCFIVIVSMFFGIKNRLLRTAIIIDSVLLLQIIYKTQSRTGIVASVVFIVSLFIFRKRKIPKIIKEIAFLVCLAFLFITVFFYDEMASLELLGETLETGRYEIYENIIKQMSFEKFLFGDFTIHFQNLHNSVLTVFATVGVFGTLAFFDLLYKKINVNKTNNNVALIGILCLIMTTATEGALLTKGSAFAASFLSVYFLCITNTGGSNESITN